MQINTVYYGDNRAWERTAASAVDNYEQANSLVAVDVNGLVAARHRSPRVCPIFYKAVELLTALALRRLHVRRDGHNEIAREKESADREIITRNYSCDVQRLW